MIIAYLLKGILLERFPKITSRTLIICLASWLLNPFSINVSTRGNAESVIGAMVLASFYFLTKKNLTLASIFYGLSVHFKIYPIIYSIPMYLYIDENFFSRKPSEYTSLNNNFKNIFKNFFNKNRLKFFLISAFTFISLTFIMYLIYGYIFLFETYLYHVIRADNRHNFSVYFYQIYLNTPIVETVGDLVGKVNGSNMIVALASFLPQVILLLAITLVYFNDLEFCLLLETITFVAFNKVCTVQYFIWYYSILPLVIPSSSLGLIQYIILFAVWMGSQGLWFYSAFNLEFLGLQTFWNIWVAGLLFFIANIYILVKLILNHNPIKVNQYLKSK
ncbi:hypothetical protein ACTFIY_001946 [Dictyostelium cf. discoideum]